MRNTENAIIVDQVYHFMVDNIYNKKGGYICPLCGGKMPRVLLRNNEPPHYVAIIPHPVQPTPDDTGGTVSSFIIECEECGRMDFFKVATFRKWLERIKSLEEKE